MKAILLAAGKGTRIARKFKDVPKSTLLVNGVPLIRRNVELLLKRNISVIVCTGYHQEVIKKVLNGLNVNYYYNPFFSATNSIASLWYAKSEIDDDVIFFNADVYFDEQILDDLILNKNDVVVAVDKSKSRCELGDYFLKLDDKQCIKKYGKNLKLEERSCEYIGIVKIKKNYVSKFNAKFSKIIENGGYNLWWEDVLYSLADDGEQISTKDYSNYFWCEIDYYDDYLRIQEHLKVK